MEKINFYVLNTDKITDRYHFVCRLVDKLNKIGNSVFIAVEKNEDAKELDELLWATPPESFLPHEVLSHVSLNEANIPSESIVISAEKENDSSHCLQDVYINLRSDLPAHHSQLNNVVEVVIKRDDVLQSTRANYKFYQDCGYPLQSHNIQNL